MRSAPPALFGRPARRIHCVGVGGMGLGPLAIYLAQCGYVVTGEDDAMAVEMQGALEQAGVLLTTVPADGELVVCSSAIGASHPACTIARQRHLPLVRRGELLAEVLRERKLVAVCGAHGKTTTTAMLVSALRRAGFPSGHVLGGLFGDKTVPPAAVGTNDWVVAEIDESDGTIASFTPEIAVVVNLDWDHPDFYPSPTDLEKTFAALMARTRGTVLINAACARSTGLAPTALSFGRAGDFAAEVMAVDGEGMTLRLSGRFREPTARVRACEDFNAINATAALAAAQLMGATLPESALADYPGVRRRQTILHARDGITVLEDYAHHPTEIRALLAGLRGRMAGAGRLIVVFQPHRYSRTLRFKAEFAAALAPADRLLLLDVYSAGEMPLAGGATADILAECQRHAPSLPVEHLTGGEAELIATLNREAQTGDWIALVGAGDIDRMARRWLDAWRAGGCQTSRWDEVAADLRRPLSSATTLNREEPLAAKTTLRVGGCARVYAEPASVADLQALVRGARRLGVEVFLLGRGSNLIIPDEGVDGLVIALAHPHWAAFALRDGGRIWAGAGLRLKNLCGLAAKAGLAGFEFLEGIPGSVGGALRMNAGAMGGWMFDVVEELQFMTLEGEVRLLPRAAVHAGYRHCDELQNAVALGALLRPAMAADADTVNRQIDVYRRKRHETQPREPSAGCVFKNPPGHSAGRLIDGSGLKGERVGDAEVSTTHANFIINRGHATSADVLELVRRVRARVQQAQGVELQPEVLLYGRDWRDVL